METIRLVSAAFCKWNGN